MKKALSIFLIILLISSCMVFLTSCSSNNESTNGKSLKIVSGSENKALQDSILQPWADNNNVDLTIDYQGSVDIANIISDGGNGYDVVWPASSIWINYGDVNGIVKNTHSIFRSPVVLGIKKSIAQKYGWINKDVYVSDLLDAMENKDLKLMMTNAAQSNSGCSAYLAFLTAFSNNTLLSMQDLQDVLITDKITRLLSNINRTAESSGFLKDLFVSNYQNFDAMMNYEIMIIEANQALEANGEEPLYAIYLKDGLLLADSPLGYIDSGDSQKEELFTSLEEYLLSDSVQEQILQTGRRTDILGVNPESVNEDVFNADWGIDATRILSTIRLPNTQVITTALQLYQTEFRKPSYTVFCLDYSGSMYPDGEKQLKEAMAQLLLPENSKKNLLQPTSNDITVVLAFNDSIIYQWEVIGNNEGELVALDNKINDLSPGGGTDIYAPAIEALTLLSENLTDNYNPSVILMTDGKSNTHDLDKLRLTLNNLDVKNIPIYCITFGDADIEDLQKIATLTGAKVYDGTTDLISAFKKAKGNN